MTPCLRSALNTALPSPTLTRTKFATLGTKGRPSTANSCSRSLRPSSVTRFDSAWCASSASAARAPACATPFVLKGARVLHHPDEFRPCNAVAEPHSGERVDFGKSSQDDDVTVFPNESKRVGRIVQIFEIGLVEDDHDVVGHARHE